MSWTLLLTYLLRCFFSSSDNAQPLPKSWPLTQNTVNFFSPCLLASSTLKTIAHGESAHHQRLLGPSKDSFPCLSTLSFLPKLSIISQGLKAFRYSTALSCLPWEDGGPFGHGISYLSPLLCSAAMFSSHLFLRLSLSAVPVPICSIFWTTASQTEPPSASSIASTRVYQMPTPFLVSCLNTKQTHLLFNLVFLFSFCICLFFLLHLLLFFYLFFFNFKSQHLLIVFSFF